MLDAAREAIAFAGDLSHEALSRDRKTLLCVIKEIEIIGEAASRVSAATRQGMPRIAWNEIVGMRNRMIHAYFDIDVRIVWDVVHTDLPDLVGNLEITLPDAPRLF